MQARQRYWRERTARTTFANSEVISWQSGHRDNTPMTWSYDQIISISNVYEEAGGVVYIRYTAAATISPGYFSAIGHS